MKWSFPALPPGTRLRKAIVTARNGQITLPPEALQMKDGKRSYGPELGEGQVFPSGSCDMNSSPSTVTWELIHPPGEQAIAIELAGARNCSKAFFDPSSDGGIRTSIETTIATVFGTFDVVGIPHDGSYRITFMAFIPPDLLFAPMLHPGAYCLHPETGVNLLRFDGDGRSFDVSAAARGRYRGLEEVVVVPDSEITAVKGVSVDSEGKLDGSDRVDTGFSSSYAADAVVGDSFELSEAARTDAVEGDYSLLHERQKASADDMKVEVSRISPKKVEANLTGAISLPLLRGAFDINWDLRITIDETTIPAKITLEGTQDGFPAYELYVNEHPLLQTSPGPGPYSSFAPLRLGPMISDKDEEVQDEL